MAEIIHDPHTELDCGDGTRVTMCFSMQCDESALAGKRAALEAAVVVALRKVATEFGGRDVRLGRTRVGPSVDTLQRVLPFVLGRRALGGAAQCYQICRPWRQQLEARGFCNKTFQLCSKLAAEPLEAAGDQEEKNEYDPMRSQLTRPAQKALQRLNASTREAERAMCLASNAFVQRSWGQWAWKDDLQEWLQAASQECAASFLSRGAASTAQFIGWPLIQWTGKPEGRYPGFCTLAGHISPATSAAFSPDGKRVVTGAMDCTVKMWDAALGTQVPRECSQVGEGGEVIGGGCSGAAHAVCWTGHSKLTRGSDGLDIR